MQFLSSSLNIPIKDDKIEIIKIIIKEMIKLTADEYNIIFMS